MRLRRFEIRNFKCIQDASFDWDDIVSLVGENNAGKSTVLQALRWFLNGAQAKDPRLFFDHVSDAAHAMELVGYFSELSERERESPAVSGRMHGDQWIIKKRFWSERASPDAEPEWKEAYFSYSSTESFANWPASDASWSGFPEEYQDLIELVPDRGARTNAEKKDALRALVRTRKPELVEASASDWRPNPGGGGNWKSNANSIVPYLIPVKAVHDAADEASSKDSSTYGKIVSLVLEQKLMDREEVKELRASFERVLKLFRPDPAHPEAQAPELKEIEESINASLGAVIGGTATIETSPLDIQPVLLPSTTLKLQDRPENPKTDVADQGHGLQRTLIVTLLQLLAETQTRSKNAESQPTTSRRGRSIILSIEEPELYLHPQMERKMRDALYALAAKPGFQVICTTHSPIFLDMAQRHKAIVRIVKHPDRRVELLQVTADLFFGADPEEERDRLRLIAMFHPTVNEVFFARRVVLFEEQTTIWAIERAAELQGLFASHPGVNRDVTFVDCTGKDNIPSFERVLNHFRIPYFVIHDEDRGNTVSEKTNVRIGALIPTAAGCGRYVVGPQNIEALLGYAATGKDKPYQALKAVEDLHARDALPPEFVKLVHLAYFGLPTAPTGEAKRAAKAE